VSEFDDLLGKGSTSKGKGRKKASQLRWNPEDLTEKKRVTRDDDEWDEWLTAAQWKAAKKEQAEEEEPDEEDEPDTLKKFAKDVGRDILKDLKKPPRRGRRGRVSPAARRKAAKDSTNITKNLTGKSALTKVAPLAMRLVGAAAVIGAVWYTVQTLQARAVRKRVEAAVAGTEARLKRPLTKAELEALLPQYERWFKEQQKADKLKSLSKL
jgi:hypothetical protein